jgi:hypothetical protein
MMGAVLFYLEACSAPPYHPARASIVTFAFLAISLGPILLVYRARSAQQGASDLAQVYPLAMNGHPPPRRDPRTALRVTRVALVAVAVISGLVLLGGFTHGLRLRECTTPVPGWPQTSATVTQVYAQWHDGSRTYIAVARFIGDGHIVCFTAPETADVVNVGEQILVTYPPGNPYVLHDLSAGPGAWRYPVYTSLTALAFVLAALVAGLTLTDQKGIGLAPAGGQMFGKRTERKDRAPVDPNERSPQLGLKWKDVQVLGELIRHGADLSRPRHVTYYLYFPGRDIAASALTEAAQPWLIGEVRQPPDGHPDIWGLILQGHAIVLSPDWVRRIDDQLQALADRFGGDYDGWEASV